MPARFVQYHRCRADVAANGKPSDLFQDGNLDRILLRCRPSALTAGLKPHVTDATSALLLSNAHRRLRPGPDPRRRCEREARGICFYGTPVSRSSEGSMTGAGATRSAAPIPHHLPSAQNGLRGRPRSLFGASRRSIGGIALVAGIPLVVAPTGDVEAISGDRVGVHEKRSASKRVGVGRAQIGHAARRGPFERTS